MGRSYMRVAVAALVALGAAGACGVLDVETVDIEAAGAVRFVDVEGGCWVIDTTDSVRYEPINLQEAMKVDGLFVQFRANRRTDLASVCQVGQLIELKSIAMPPD